ncbi:MAG: hypothetical protein GXW99_07485 [Clostridiales bacterium]|nr:hypothetical protein [Clostridiales bacterium]
MTISLTKAQIEYTVARLLEIAGIQTEEQSISGNTASFGRGQVVFTLISETDTAALLDGSYPVSHVPSADGQVSLPLFGGEGKPFTIFENNNLTVCADIVTYSFLLLSRMEELLLEKPDQYGRMSYADSLQKCYGTIDLPIVDEYAMLLRREIQQAFPEIPILHRSPKLLPTHDLDDMFRFMGMYQSLRSILSGDLLRRKSVALAAKSWCEWHRTRRDRQRDPMLQACRMLADDSKENGLTSLFFLMGVAREEKDFRYDCTDPDVVRCLRELIDSGAKIGFHGGMGTSENKALFARQKQRTEEALCHPVTALRQHYLCFRPDQTPMIWEENEITDDYTLTYYDREGFCCGTCHPYPLFDLTNDRVMQVMEHPLLVMDGTVREYRDLTVEEASISMRVLAQRVRAVEGDFVLLWHNGNIFREWATWYENVYRTFLKEEASAFKNLEGIDK